MSFLLRNVSFLICLLGTGFSALAQSPSFVFGIKGGLNFSQLALSDDKIPNGIKPGIHIGLATTYHVSQSLFLQSGLSFTTKGAKIKGTAPIGFPETMLYPGRDALLKSNQMYVQMPLFVGYSLEVGPSTRLLLNAGPYFAYGLGGKAAITGDIMYGDMIEYSTLDEPTFGNRGLHRFDYGLGAGVNLDLGKTIVGISSELGLRNIAPTAPAYLPFYSTGYKNRNVAISLEYKL